MKNKLFKTLTIFGLSFIAWNCSNDPASPSGATSELPAIQQKQMLEVDQQSWLLNTGSQVFLIVPNGTGTYTVTDAFSNPVGTFNTTTKSISDAAGNTTVVNVDLSSLPIVNPDKTITYPDGSKTTLTGEPISSGVVVNSSSATAPGTVVVSSSSVYNPSTNPVVNSSSAKATPVASSSSQKAQQPVASSSSKQQNNSGTSDKQCNGQCYDSASGKCVDPHTTLKGSHDEQYAYDESCKVNCYYDPTNQNCKNLGGGSAAPASSASQPKSSSSAKSSSSQQQQQPKSSSSAKSSSSQQQIKSSSSQATNPNASAEEAKYLNAGAGGQQGFATRYWDCCMPHCAWPEHGGKAKTCDAKGKTPIGNNNGSICSNGQGTTCTSQTPIIVSEKLAYAFAATPGNDNTCGKCFALTFTGQGKYETKANHQALKGKTLVVMASNIGYDVQGGQFDVMIPGGGVGAFNGCANMGWGDQGAQYGGLLSKCEDEVGYDGDLLTKRKQCLTEKCNKSFANDAEAKEGCLFLATWMEAAGNPLHTYKEVDCPQALIQKF